MNSWKTRANAFQQEMFLHMGQPFILNGNREILLRKMDFAFKICYGPRYLENENMRVVTERVVLQTLKLFNGSEKFDQLFFCAFLNLKLKDRDYGECKFCVFYLRNAYNVECCIDLDARIYRSWEDFLKNNKLPRCFIAYPKFGKYYYHNATFLPRGNYVGWSNRVEVIFDESVSCSSKSFMKNFVDVLSVIGGIVSAGILIYRPVSMTLLYRAFAGVVITGSYASYVGVNQLYDAYEYEGDISFNNSKVVLTVSGILFTVFGLLVIRADIKSVQAGIPFLLKYNLPVAYKFCIYPERYIPSNLLNHRV